MTLKFNLADLQAFVVVAEVGSFRKAAETVHVSQSAFSRRIDKLEVALGVRLLDRTTRSVSLTVVGRDFAQKARFILNELDSTLLGISEVSATRMGEVTIACVPSAVYYFLPAVIKRYHERFPKIRVKILDDSANNVLSAVANSEADFGLNFIGTQDADIEFKKIFEEKFVAACRKDHPLARKKKVRWSELAEYDFITVGKSSGNRLLMDLALANVPGRPHSVYEAQHVLTLLGLVEAGLGVAAVPQLAMPNHDHPILASVPLVEPSITRTIGLITRRGRSLSPAAKHLYTFLAESKSAPRAKRRRACPAYRPPEKETP